VAPAGVDPSTIVHRHLRFGWWALLAFASMGLALESMHGFKVGLYLDLANETRRLMWTLAHAHGVLLSLVNVAFAATLAVLPPAEGAPLPRLSQLLRGATLLLPLGFFLGGAVVHGGDPSLGVLLVPVGALMLLASIAGTALALRPKR
jgi:hypothetical protein